MMWILQTILSQCGECLSSSCRVSLAEGRSPNRSVVELLQALVALLAGRHLHSCTRNVQLHWGKNNRAARQQEEIASQRMCA